MNRNFIPLLATIMLTFLCDAPIYAEQTAELSLIHI